MIISRTFSKVVVRHPVKTKCQVCSKPLRRMLSDIYFRNGFHNERKTRIEIEKHLAKKAKKLAKEGVVCQSCERVLHGVSRG